MRVLLRPEVFTAADHVELMVLLWLGSIGRHRVIPYPFDNPEYSRWLDQTEPETQLLWRAMVDVSLRREIFEPSYWELIVDSSRNIVWEGRTATMPIVPAVDLLFQPYRILLENNLSDRAFVLALCGGVNAKVLRESEERGWLVFEMGGGSGVVPRARTIRASEQLRRRSSILIDSDARRPPDEGNSLEIVEDQQARHVREAVRDAVPEVHLHVLRRRAIENYLPIITLERWAHGNPDLERAVEELGTLTEPQRRHYNMKNGFTRDARDTTQAARAGDLYDGVTQDVKKLLSSGFGKDIAERFEDAVKAEDIDADARDEVRAFVEGVLARMR